MDNKIIDIILDRFDKLEEKVDKLMAAHWKQVGGVIVLSIIGGFLSSLLLAFIERS
jgi:hypothetical protein